MKLQDLQKLHPNGHDFRIYSRETKKYDGYSKSIWIEWIEVGKLEWIEISELNISYLDNEYSFELVMYTQEIECEKCSMAKEK